MKYKKTTLNNGLRVITVPMKNTQTVTVVVMVGVGSRYETEKEAGLSHFIEHMLLKGTKKRPSWSDIAKEIDSVGGYHNASTSKDITSYYAKVDAKHTNMALDIISDIYLNSLIKPAEIKKERGAIIQEMKMYEDDPKRNIGDIFEELLYKGSPLGREIIGNEKTLKSFERKDFLNYIKKFYSGRDTVVCIAGNLKEKEIVETAKKLFSGLKKKHKPEVVKANDRQNEARFKIKFKKTEQTTLLVGNRAYHRSHGDRFVLNLIAVILGGNTSSRIFSEVREKRGLAYYVKTGIEAFEDCGYIATQAGVEHEKLELALKTIIGEYKKIATKKISKDELQRVKSYARGSMVMGLESSDDVAMFYVEEETARGKIMTPEEIFARIDKVTADDILRVAKDIFKEKTLNLAVIGPHRDGKKLEKILKL